MKVDINNETQKKKQPKFEKLKNFNWLTLDRALMGTFFAAGKGTGKTRCTVRDLVWRWFWMEIGIIYFDPVGAGVLNFVDKVLRLPRAKQPAAWKRVRIIRFSGEHLPGLPLYYRLGNESLYQISQRFLETVLRLDPALQSASVEGWNALKEVGTNAGMILAVLGLQITEMEDLLLHPKKWKPLLQRAKQLHPEAAPAVEYFYIYMNWDARTRARKISTLLGKIQMFKLDPQMRAIFGANHLSLDLDDVRDQGMIVFLDTSGLTGQTKQFVDAWLFQFVLDYVKHLGVGRRKPLALVVDELAAIVNKNTTGKVDYVAADIQQLADVWARNASLMYVFMSQHLHAQFSPDMVSTLLSSGNVIIGNMSDEYDRQILAKQFIPYHADRINHREPVYSGHPPQIIDWRPKFFSVSEKQAIAAQAFNLAKFRFVGRTVRSEGDITGFIRPLNFEGLDRGIWVNEELVKPVIDLLVARDEPPYQDRLRENEGRLENLRQSDPPSEVVPPSSPLSTVEPVAQDTEEMPLVEETDTSLIDLLEEWKKQPLQKKWDIPFMEVT